MAFAGPQGGGRLPIIVEKEPSSWQLRSSRWGEVSEACWSDWRWQLRQRVRDLSSLEETLEVSASERDGVVLASGHFSFAVTPHYLALMKDSSSLRRQVIPDRRELEVQPFELEDPLGEERYMPVPGLTHRYPDRALLYMTEACPLYCRHCTRKRKVSRSGGQTILQRWDEALAYLRAHPEVRDVLVSGGEPLLLSDARLAGLLRDLRSIRSIDSIRLCTRAPVTLPQRIGEGLVSVLRELGPVVVMTHFNHPDEASVESARALAALRMSGAVLMNQSVLLAGVNDSADILEPLFRWLVRQGVKPYYLFQCDLAQGVHHFRTPLSRGLEIVESLRGRLSGIAIPTFVVDLPGGEGKVTLSPDWIEGVRGGESVLFRSWRGSRVIFPDVVEEKE